MAFVLVNQTGNRTHSPESAAQLGKTETQILDAVVSYWPVLVSWLLGLRPHRSGPGLSDSPSIPWCPYLLQAVAGISHPNPEPSSLGAGAFASSLHIIQTFWFPSFPFLTHSLFLSLFPLSSPIPTLPPAWRSRSASVNLQTLSCN